MTQLEQIARMAKILTAIAQQGEYRPQSIEAIRWHVRGLFVAAYSEASGHSRGQDPNRVRVAQKLDEELTRLGNVIWSATARVGPLYFPSEGLKEPENDVK